MNIRGAFRVLFSRPAAEVVEVNRPIRARYDAAQTGGINDQHWAAADGLDADSANSIAVRRTLTRRARYEAGNNGYGKGVVLTQANYVVGRGPKLRMQTGSPGFNSMIEAAWIRWSKQVKFARKLRTAIKAKTVDGEAFIIARANPALRDVVKLDLVGVECEQVMTPSPTIAEPNRVDGIKFDEFGNPLWYDVLKYHPGSTWYVARSEAERVPAKFMFHLFREDRPGQHRAVPEMSPTLNSFALGRRYREATVAGAENIANFSLFIKTQQAPDDGADQVRPLTSLPIDKSMMVALPSGWDAFQPKAEQPSATYEMFTRSLVCEQARPLNMPYNIAAADSSGYSFSGGRLDHLTYFVGVDTDQADIEDLVLEPLFALWFEEAKVQYGWTVPSEPAPLHTWDWPARPQIDDAKTAGARQTNLSTGMASLRRLYAEDGLDFEEELQAMAEDYGMTLDEMRAVLLKVNLLKNAPPEPSEPDDAEDDDTPPPRTNGQTNRLAKSNGFARQT